MEYGFWHWLFRDSLAAWVLVYFTVILLAGVILDRRLFRQFESAINGFEPKSPSAWALYLFGWLLSFSLVAGNIIMFLCLTRALYGVSPSAEGLKDYREDVKLIAILLPAVPLVLSCLLCYRCGEYYGARQSRGWQEGYSCAWQEGYDAAMEMEANDSNYQTEQKDEAGTVRATGNAVESDVVELEGDFTAE